MTCFRCVLQVSKPSQEAYQNELNIESVERSFILSARSVPPTVTSRRAVSSFERDLIRTL